MMETNLFYALLSLVILAPLPYASVSPWARGIETAIVGALVVSSSAILLTYRLPPARAARFILLPFLLFMSAVVWALWQISGLNPVTWNHPLWKDVSELFGAPYRGTISINPARSLDGIAHLLTVGGVFWLAVQLCVDVQRARKAVLVLAVANFIYAAYGIIEFFSGTESILWMSKFAYFGDLTSTFVNRNNYATFAGLGWLCFLSLLYHDTSHAMRGIKKNSERLRELVVYIEKKGWMLLVGVLVEATALLLSHSRAGFASTILGIIAFCGFLALGRKLDKAILRGFGAACVVLALAFYIASGKGVDERLGSTSLASEDRLTVYAKTEEAILNQPMLGTGLGTFEDVFRFYRPPSIEVTFDYAHDVYLESALELGIPATLALIGAALTLFVAMVRGARVRRRDEVYPCLGAAACVLVGAHSIVDFSVQIPAVAYFFAFILGIGVAQSFSSHPLSAPH